MTAGDSAEGVSAPGERRETGERRAPGWLVPAVVTAAFLALFFPIIAVRVHFYLETPRYSHCLLLPFVAGLWIWERWAALRAIPRSVSGRGMTVLFAAILLYLFGRLPPADNLSQHVAMLAALAGVVWTLAGLPLLRALAFPIGYLVLTIPFKPWDEKITVPLQGIATTIAERFFDALGWVVVREGNVLQLPGLKLLVEEGCSGIHSLFALLALAVAWVAFVERPAWLKITLVAAIAPISVVANAIRVASTGVLAYKVDPKYAHGVSHETAGMIVFAIGVTLLLGLDWCLKPDAPLPEKDEPPAKAPQDGDVRA